MKHNKRGTESLRKAGIERLIIRKFLFGYSLYDPDMVAQQGRCHSTVKQCVDAALAGERPQPLQEN